MQRLLAVLLVLIGLIGLVLGRLGETTWAPETETTATATLEDPGPAVVIDPGVLYVGGEKGEVVIEGASDVSVITASNSDIDAYLEGVHHTRVTGASDWSTLSTEDVEPDGAAEISDPTGSDLWRSVDTSASPYTLDIGEFWAAENGENEQVYRSLLIVTDGTAAGADKISITWPVDDENEWVPYAYAGGAAIAVIGLVLLVVSIGRRGDEDEGELLEEPQEARSSAARTSLATGGAAAGAAAGGLSQDRDGSNADADSSDAPRAEDPLDAPGAREVGEQSVWSIGDRADDAGTGADGTASDAGSDGGSPGADPSGDDADQERR
ncbi:MULTISPECIES: hypothetical protein [Brachybacterium]|uniref:Uncharacterized protein n=2 Tax=Brachybacterium TaxID=43668 RepID=A0A426SHC2_9MICO|nr:MULTISPECIES: hypothetical protein [Brachybacterium]MCT1436088.1 hypothetical protein [Brachybacterium paraconglomeratum]RRR17510.1 hypothetical protein DS079_14250 [Brachybacterium paraconglomeratum]GLI31043.1 hypothetical protein BCONGLO52_18840 [Brachybacterium conglomeratum]GLK06282.1 hypothetical protein GCM10017597_30820 [Brachybacterium conglomeratum]